MPIKKRPEFARKKKNKKELAQKKPEFAQKRKPKRQKRPELAPKKRLEIAMLEGELTRKPESAPRGRNIGDIAATFGKARADLKTDGRAVDRQSGRWRNQATGGRGVALEVDGAGTATEHGLVRIRGIPLRTRLSLNSQTATRRSVTVVNW